MFEAYNNLDPLLKVYWGIAIFSSLVFIVQAIITFIGLGGDDVPDGDLDGDMDGDGDMPFQIFTFKNLIHFLLGFSWTGISLYSVIPNKILLNVVAFLVGGFFIFLFFFIIKQLMKLAEDNSFEIESAVGKTADVYLGIPPSKQGKGKVTVSIKGALHELNAITEDDAKIETGTVVKITDAVNDIVIVTRV